MIGRRNWRAVSASLRSTDSSGERKYETVRRATRSISLWADSRPMRGSSCGESATVAIRMILGSPVAVSCPRASPGSELSIIARCEWVRRSEVAAATLWATTSSTVSRPSISASTCSKNWCSSRTCNASKSTSRPPGNSRYTEARDTPDSWQMSSIVTFEKPNRWMQTRARRELRVR